MTKRERSSGPGPEPATPVLRTLSTADLAHVQGGKDKKEKQEYLKVELQEVYVSSVG